MSVEKRTTASRQCACDLRVCACVCGKGAGGTSERIDWPSGMKKMFIKKKNGGPTTRGPIHLLNVGKLSLGMGARRGAPMLLLTYLSGELQG